jgi:hypothetical protein
MSPVLNCPHVAVIAALLFGGLCSPPVITATQANTALQVGSKVRYKLAAPRARWRQGELTGLDSDSLRLVGEDRAGYSVATPRILALQVSSGRRSNTGRGAAIGGVIGAALGLGLGIAATTDECTGFCPAPEIGAQEVVAAAAVLGGVGAGIGALIGATSKRDRWVEVSRPWSVPPALK